MVNCRMVLSEPAVSTGGRAGVGRAGVETVVGPASALQVVRINIAATEKKQRQAHRRNQASRRGEEERKGIGVTFSAYQA